MATENKSKEEPKLSTVKHQEYTDAGVLPDADDVRSERISETSHKAGKGMKLGEPASHDVWQDIETGEFGTEQPVRGKQLVRKGEIVTGEVLENLEKAK